MTEENPAGWSKPEQLRWPRGRDNHGELAASMLKLVDQSPDRLGIIEIPRCGGDR